MPKGAPVQGALLGDQACAFSGASLGLRRVLYRLAPFAALAALAACASPPDADAALGAPPPGEDYPTLGSLSEILELEASIRGETSNEVSNAELEQRAAALRARAAELRALSSSDP
ncbi:MAG: hypothetical protein AAF566_02565 [Pseudomonadota bacterium]